MATEFLEDQGIERMEWHANSPDLNPLEHLWDQLKRSVYRRLDANSNLDDLRRLLQEEWVAIPQHRVARLINTMRDRCRQVATPWWLHTVLRDS